MMESCLNGKPERATAITVEDLKRNLSDDFSDISSLSQDSLSDKEHLQVYLRVRPFTNSEQEAGESQGCVEVQGPDTVVFKAPRISLPGRLSEKPVQTGQKFRFSQVYGPETTQRQMFEGAAKGLVKDVLEGGNSLVFTYGVTNAGKTFTFLGPESDGGIVPRSLRVIFQSIEGRIYTQNNIKPHRCMDFTRLTKVQQDEESTSKRSLLKRLKETDAQKSLTCKTLLEGSTSSDIDMQSEEECVSLDADPNMKFSVWVSFCEIYNESIHDLLEVLPSGPPRRTALRLSQDVKGNTFVKDLKWIQVNSAEEAYRVLKIGRRNQSFSSTKLNTLSSRSHSIFSIRILRVEDVGVPRVLTISELSLCDLAGSERCAKTQNRGERLKEAGNINTSLLTLGKCITALRLNQTQPKFQAHIPFRESKLTHYLQGFFCGRGKACMIVNINQCASMYDETLNVLKFSAVAQKVVVLSTRPPAPEPKKSGREVSFIINEADRHHLWGRRRSTLIAWETTLEDVQEDEASEEEEEGEEEEEDEEEEEESADETMAEGTVLEAGEEEEDDSRHEEVKELRRKLAQQQAEKLALECRIREEVTSEFMELFSKMESDYNERLQKEKEIIEERAEHRLEILKELVKKNASEFAEVAKEESSKEERMEFMDNMLAAMRSDLAKIKQDAEQAQTMLVVADGAGTPRATVSAATETEAVTELRKQLDEMAEELLTRQQLLGIKSTELERVQAKAERSTEHLLEIQENYERQTVKVQELMAMCQQKDEMMAKLQEALDHSVEATTKDRSLIDSIREEILRFRQSCRCGANDEASDLRQNDDTTVSMRAELGRLRAESVAKDQRQREASQRLYSMEQTAQELQAALADETQLHEATLTSLEKERQEMAALEADRNAVAEDRDRLKIANDELRSKVVAVETEKADVEAGWKVLAEERDRLRAENEALADDAQLHNATLASLEKERQEMAALEANRNALAEDCDRLKITNDELKSKLDAAETEAASLKATNDELRSKMDAAETKMATLEADRNSLAEERDRLKATSDELRSKVDAAETETASLKADRNTLAEERNRLNDANAELTSKVDEAEKEAKGRSKDSAKVDDELRAAQALANRHEEDALEKSKMAAALEKDVERLKAEVEALQASHLQAQASNGSGDGTNGSGASDGQMFSEALTGLQQECESLALQSREKRERIRELEKELEDARLQMQQLEEVCGELEALCEHQQRESQSLQSQLEAKRSALATAQRGHADLLQETQGLREQLSQAKEEEETRRASREQQQEPAVELPEETREGLLQEARERVAELERRLQEADTQRSSLEEKLREAQSQDGGTTRGGGGEDQQGAETAGMQKLLTQHGADMEALAKELSERKEQVQENLEVIRSLGQDLKLRDRDIAWLRERLRERESEIEQLLYKISRINDENSALQRRVSDTERLKNEAMRLKDQTILQMTTDQPSTLADSPHPSSKVSPDLPIKEQIIQHLRSRLTEQISPAQQEELLDAKLKEVESLTAELMSLKECCRQEGVSVNSGVGRSELSDGRPDETTRLKMEVPVPAAAPELGSSRSRSPGPAEEQTPQQTSSPVGNQAPERPLTSMCTQPNSPVATGDDLRQGQRSPQEEELHKKEEKMKKEKEEKKKEESEDSSDPRPEGERRQEENSEVHGRLSPPQGDDTTSRTQEVSILDASEVTWSCSRARRFPNQSDLDVSFTPPTERINKWVAWDSEERPKPSPRLRQSTQSKSTTKLRRTSRKRKKAEGQGQSENRAEEDKPKSSSPLKRRSKMNYQESPTVLGKVASQIITQQGSSPTPLRSKGAARSVKKASTTSVSSTSSEPENTQQLAGKQPRRTKRKLYKANNHGPLDLGSPLAMVPDQEDKEGDHLIIKRKLRTRTAKI